MQRSDFTKTKQNTVQFYQTLANLMRNLICLVVYKNRSCWIFDRAEIRKEAVVLTKNIDKYITQRNKILYCDFMFQMFVLTLFSAGPFTAIFERF